ncbi:hypothetical protein Ahy_B02g058333 [Arachis hypogaea]|uniref:GRF-type domain-containing protein n=1 Tax=Arachis hypogaea TaxID=3818 RepID=A0A445AEE3_ARAHY|nr:hypothetical protein Ahy_B02g058333 [Arachis hypogaea]
MGSGERSQSSSSRNNSVERPYGSKGMCNRRGKNAIFCNCGLQTVMKYSTTVENPSRPFFDCPNYEVSMDCNFFCWADGCEEPVCVTSIPQEVLLEFNWRMANLESDVKTLKIMTMVLLAFVVTFCVCLGISLLGFIVNK